MCVCVSVHVNIWQGVSAPAHCGFSYDGRVQSHQATLPWNNNNCNNWIWAEVIECERLFPQPPTHTRDYHAKNKASWMLIWDHRVSGSPWATNHWKTNICVAEGLSLGVVAARVSRTRRRLAVSKRPPVHSDCFGCVCRSFVGHMHKQQPQHNKLHGQHYGCKMQAKYG